MERINKHYRVKSLIISYLCFDFLQCPSVFAFLCRSLPFLSVGAKRGCVQWVDLLHMPQYISDLFGANRALLVLRSFFLLLFFLFHSSTALLVMTISTPLIAILALVAFLLMLCSSMHQHNLATLAAPNDTLWRFLNRKWKMKLG